MSKEEKIFEQLNIIANNLKNIGITLEYVAEILKK